MKRTLPNEAQYHEILRMNVLGYDLFSIQCEMIFMGNQLPNYLIASIINFANFGVLK